MTSEYGDTKCNNCGRWYCTSEFKCVQNRLDYLEELIKKILSKLGVEELDEDEIDGMG